MNNRIFQGLLFCFALVFLFVGCGDGDGGLSDWETPVPTILTGHIEGKVLAPVVGANQQLASVLVNVKGTKVFVEQKPDYFCLADENGNFVIRDVPAGKYNLIAEQVSGTTHYRNRSEQINLTGEYETLLLDSPMQLLIAPYRVKFEVSDIKSKDSLVSAKFKSWGREFLSSSEGIVDVGPFPQGVWPISVEVGGYHSLSFLAGFDDRKNAQIQIKMTPLSAVDKNRAPIAEIEQGFRTIRVNDQGTLTATGFDPDGDRVIYSWNSDGGTFLQNTGASTVFTAPPAEGQVKITLNAKDANDAESECVLLIDVLSGSSLPPNPNNRPPDSAANPIPAHLATNIGSDVTLRWTGSDPDNDSLEYDLFLALRGTDMSLVAEGLDQAFYDLRYLEPNSIYYWKIITRDIYGAISPNPQTWQFTTGDQDNFSPYQPANPFPDDLAKDQLPSLQFTWTGGDPDVEDIVNYRFYLSDDPDNLELATITRKTSFETEGLSLDTDYYWQIIAADNRGKETKGPVWRFSTYSTPNRAPYDPVLLYPASGAANLSIDVQLRWESQDPDDDLITYDVYLGESFPLQKVGSNQNIPTYTPSSPYLKNLTTYYLQVVARDTEGLTNPNPMIWSFTTSEKVNQTPNVPVAVFPEDNAVNIALKPMFKWSGGDPDGDAVKYFFYLTDSLPFVEPVASNLTDESYHLSYELEEGREYFWKILAVDEAENESESKVFSFFSVTDSDTQPPEILSIYPEDNQGNLSQDFAVNVVFSEPVLKSSAEIAFGFLPESPGTWNWENDSSAIFWRRDPWPKGSWHRFVIADNLIRDLAGNLMTSGQTVEFTIDSDIPVPSGYKSTGFPVTALLGDSVEVNVPGLQSGKNSYAVVVAGGASTDFNVQASYRTENAMIKDPQSAFREFEKRLAFRDIPETMLGQSTFRASLRAAQVGDEEEFYIPEYGQVATSTPYPQNKITARCYGATENVYVYIDKSVSNPSSDVVAEVRKRFEEGILPNVREAFGMEPEEGPDGDRHITILLTNGLSTGIAGIFNSADLFVRDQSDVQLRESNERKIFYVKYSLESDITRYGTLAHEFQHMVNFWQKRLNGGSGFFEETWLNEGLSKFSEEVCGYGVLQGDKNTALLLKLSQENFTQLSLTEWEGLNSYGLSYLFVRFLAHESRYGTTPTQVTRNLVKSGLKGAQNVEAITNEPFETTLARWAISLYVNDYFSSGSDSYGFYQLNLAGGYSGVALPGFNPVSLDAGNNFAVSLKRYGALGFVKRSSGMPSTNFELDSFGRKVNIWMFDQR